MQPVKTAEAALARFQKDQQRQVETAKSAEATAKPADAKATPAHATAKPAEGKDDGYLDPELARQLPYKPSNADLMKILSNKKYQNKGHLALLLFASCG